jgi:hypothetical protein
LSAPTAAGGLAKEDGGVLIAGIPTKMKFGKNQQEVDISIDEED